MNIKITLFFRLTIAMIIAIVALLNTACSSVDDNTEKPAPLVQFTPTVKVQSLWSRSAGSGFEDNDITLQLAKENGRLFIASEKGQLMALSQGNGRRLWSTSTDMTITGGPGVGGDLVIVGSDSGDVKAYHARDGKPAWKAKLTSQILSAPIANDTIVVAKSIDGNIAGFGTGNGKTKWDYTNPTGSLILRGDSSPRLKNNVVIAGFSDGKVFAFDLNSGRIIWQHIINLPDGSTPLQRLVDIDATPVIYQGAIYVVNYHGKAEALSLDKGQVLWSRGLSSYTGLAVSRRAVYVTDTQGHVWAFDRQNGSVLWRQKKLQARQLTAPVVMGRYVVVADREGYIHWLNRENGQFATRIYNGSGVIKTQPVVSHNRLFVLTDSGNVSAYRFA